MPTTALTVIQGDITRQQDCDGIVNSANARLIAGGGVCGAIHRAAGPELEAFSARLAPLALGDAVATPGFALGCRCVIHTHGPKYLFDTAPQDNLAKALHSALVLADQTGLTRLAVPAISMGVYGYPEAEAVPILVRTAAGLRSTFTSLLEVRFVVVSDALLSRFQAELQACP